MAQFEYVVRNQTGKKQTGKMKGNSKREVYEQLKEKRYGILEIKEVPETVLTRDISFGKPMKLKDFVMYLRQFSTLLRAGVPILDATHILAAQTDSKGLKIALQSIEEDIRSGQSLSTSYAKHPRLFNNLFINMVKAGESTGQLDEALESMANYFEKQLRLRQKIQAAMSYPVAVGILAVLVVMFLLVKVVPTFVAIFEDLQQELPAITKFIINSSNWMKSYWWTIILLSIVIYATFYIIKNNKNSKYYLDYAILKLPIFGTLFRQNVIARLSRTLSSLLSSGVPILEAMPLVQDVVENEVFSRALQKSQNSLKMGQALSEPLKEHWVFPPIVSQMIAVGEETGSLDHMLLKVSEFYEGEVEYTSDRLKALIEPLMIIFLTSIVGVIVLAIIIPLFKLYNSF
ncbi:type II secretion system F family protein [Bacillus sp. JJ664]